MLARPLRADHRSLTQLPWFQLYRPMFVFLFLAEKHCSPTLRSIAVGFVLFFIAADSVPAFSWSMHVLWFANCKHLTVFWMLLVASTRTFELFHPTSHASAFPDVASAASQLCFMPQVIHGNLSYPLIARLWVNTKVSSVVNATFLDRLGNHENAIIVSSYISWDMHYS